VSPRRASLTLVAAWLAGLLVVSLCRMWVVDVETSAGRVTLDFLLLMPLNQFWVNTQKDHRDVFQTPTSY